MGAQSPSVHGVLRPTMILSTSDVWITMGTFLKSNRLYRCFTKYFFRTTDEHLARARVGAQSGLGPGPGWGPYGPIWALMGPYGPLC